MIKRIFGHNKSTIKLLEFMLMSFDMIQIHLAYQLTLIYTVWRQKWHRFLNSVDVLLCLINGKQIAVLDKGCFSAKKQVLNRIWMKKSFSSLRAFSWKRDQSNYVTVYKLTAYFRFWIQIRVSKLLKYLLQLEVIFVFPHHRVISAKKFC